MIDCLEGVESGISNRTMVLEASIQNEIGILIGVGEVRNVVGDPQRQE